MISCQNIAIVHSPLRFDYGQCPKEFLALLQALQRHVVCQTNGVHHCDRLIIPHGFREYFDMALLAGNVRLRQLIEGDMAILIYQCGELLEVDQQMVLLEAARFPAFGDNLEFALQRTAYPLAAIVVQLGQKTAEFPFSGLV